MKQSNRLIKESSPYLLQHAYNPVDWFPWGKEAFDNAKKENKPVFLSIGYASCHWCHVMEKESFEHEEIAAYLNEHFIAIKVDREERPDIDAAYMDFAVASTGSGGWPLSVFLTSEKEPFFAGTYFPPLEKYGMPSFLQVLQRVKERYHGNREQIAAFIQEMQKHLQHDVGGEKQPLQQNVLRRFDTVFLQHYDEEHGGMLGMPKFPITLQLLHLLERKQYLEKVFHTLKKMGNGGIYDHLDGGFFRYSVDNSWMVPHFEKMLYDNALLLKAYAWAFALSKDAYFKEKADGIFEFVKREMLSEKGFYSSQDADSEGEEGKYYVFTKEEIQKTIHNPELFCKYFSITSYGNFKGKNVLFVDEAITLNQEQKNQIEQDKKRLFTYRNKRKHPAIDTKIIVSWNALMISGLISYGRYCNNEEALTLARKVLDSLLEDCDKNKRLLRISGKKDLPGFLEDYSFLINALLDIYEVSFEEHYLATAKELAERAKAFFYHDYFSERSSLHEPLYAEIYSAQDNVMPSGISMMIKALFRLNLIEHSPQYETMITSELERNMLLLEKMPVQYPVLLGALSGLYGDFYSVEASGGKDFVGGVWGGLLRLPVFNMQIFPGRSKNDEIKVCFRNTCRACKNKEGLFNILLEKRNT